MPYISPSNEYPRHIGDIQIEHPDFQDGQDLPDGWKAVLETVPPVPNDGQVVYEISPIEIDGIYQQAFDVRDLTPEEILRSKINEVRMKVRMNQSLTEAEAMLLVG